MNTVLLVMAIKRSNGNPSVGGYSSNDRDRRKVEDDFTDIEYLRAYGAPRYQGTVEEKLAMLTRDLAALEYRIGKTNAR